MSFGGGTPSLPPAQPMPAVTDPEIKAAKERERRAMLMRKGRSSTILADQQNMPEPTLGKKSLLGE